MKGRVGGQESSTQNAREAFSQRQEIKEVEDVIGTFGDRYRYNCLTYNKNL